MGKWDGLRGVLPPLQSPNEAAGSEWWGKVRAGADELKQNLTKEQIARNLAATRDELDALEDQVSDLQRQRAQYELALAEVMEDGGEAMFKLDSGASFSVQVEPYAKVADRDVLRDWLISNGFLEQLALPWQTLNSVAKQRLEDGEEPPPGVELFLKRKVVLRGR